jgi:hypothetical protein
MDDSLFTRGNCATARSYDVNPSGEATQLRLTSTRTAIGEASTYPVSDYHFT